MVYIYDKLNAHGLQATYFKMVLQRDKGGVQKVLKGKLKSLNLVID